MEEEVVFEGSPLAQHLTNVGVEFEVVDCDTDDLQEEFHGPQENIEDTIRIWESKNSTVIDLRYRKRCMELIFNSDLLIHEDSILLKEFMEEVNSRSFASNLRPTLRKGTIDALMVGGVLIITPWRIIPQKLFTAFCCSVPVFLSWRWRSIWTSPAQTRKFKSFLEIAKKLDDAIKKALRIIGDCSLISRGYLLLPKSGAVWRTVNPNLGELFMKSQANLPGLRRSLLNVCRRLSSVLTEATNELRRKSPLPYNLDHRDLYIPELEESIDLNSLPKVEKLRSAVNKQILLRSQYLRRLFLHFLLIDTSPMDIMWNNALLEQMQCCLGVIESGITLYRPYVSSLTEPRKVTPSKPQSSLDELRTTCYSTRAHLHEALHNSQELENVVFKCDNMSLLDSEKVDELNHIIQYHLQCANFCIERSVIVCGKSARKNSPTPVPAISESVPSNQVRRADISSEERVDIAPCDEVFILYNKGGREKGEEEEETAKPRNEVGQFMVLQELKNVLAVKAADWKEREKAALRQRSGDLLDLSGLESDPEDDVSIEDSSSLSKREIETKKLEKEETNKSVFDKVAPSSRNEYCDIGTPVINEPFQGLETTNFGGVAAEAVAKARSQLPTGLMSNVQSFGSSDSEESLSD